MAQTFVNQQIVAGSSTYTVPAGKVLLFQACLLALNVASVAQVNGIRVAGIFSSASFPGPAKSGWLAAAAGDVISAAAATSFGFAGILFDAPLSRTPVSVEINSAGPITYTVPAGQVFLGYANIVSNNTSATVVVDGVTLASTFSSSGFNGENRVPLALHAGQVVSTISGSFGLNGALYPP